MLFIPPGAIQHPPAPHGEKKKKNTQRRLSHLSAMCTPTVKIYQQFETRRAPPLRAASQLERQAECVCASVSQVLLQRGVGDVSFAQKARGAPLILAASQDQINRLTASRKCRFIIWVLLGRVSAPFPHTSPSVGGASSRCRLPSVLLKFEPSPTPGAQTLSFQL